MINVQQKMKPSHWTFAPRKKRKKRDTLIQDKKLTSSPSTFNTYVKKGWIYECKHGSKVKFIPINH